MVITSIPIQEQKTPTLFTVLAQELRLRNLPREIDKLQLFPLNYALTFLYSNKKLSHGVNSHKTLKAYRSCLRSFVKYFTPRHPRELTTEDIRNYLLHLIEKEKLAASTVNQAYNAIRFLSRRDGDCVKSKNIFVEQIPFHRLVDEKKEIKRIYPA